MSVQSKILTKPESRTADESVNGNQQSSEELSGWDSPQAAILAERHSILVDKKFGEGLSAEEEKELDQINKLMDDYDAPFYEPFIERLRALHEQLTQSGRSQSETK